jgi:hypothetical protein
LDDEIMKNEIGWNMYRVLAGEERYMQGFDGGNLTERDCLEDLGIGGKIILKLTLKT